MITKIRNWIKTTDTFEVMAIIAIILGALVVAGSFWLGSQNDLILTGHQADIVDLSEYIGSLVGSLWSLAGVLLFYASLSSQKEDLENQKELLVKQIDEVVAQTKEFRIQNEMAKEQKNEETFFQLLRFHNEIISSITIEQQEVDFVSGENISKIIEGRKAFVEYYDIYKRFFQEASEATYSQDEEGIIRIFDKSYNSFYLEYQADLGHYFRNLNNILLFIDSIKSTQQAFYLGLLMAQLSNYELTLLFFHCLRSTNKDFKTLVEKYAILEQVPKDEVTTMAYKLYAPHAFGESGFGSGDVIEDEEVIENESSVSNIDTENILSRFNFGDITGSQSNDMLTPVESDEKSTGTMEDILSKLKNLSSEKFPHFQELDNLGTESGGLENPLKKLKINQNEPEKESKPVYENSDDNILSLEDFFDDDESDNLEHTDSVINSDQIEKMVIQDFENKTSSNFDYLFDNNEDAVVNSDEDEKLDLNADFANLWGDDDNHYDEDIINAYKKNIYDYDEFANFKSNFDEDSSEIKDISSLIDNDLDENSILFNKDADIIKEKASFNDISTSSDLLNDDFNYTNDFNIDIDKIKSLSNQQIPQFDDNNFSTSNQKQENSKLDSNEGALNKKVKIKVNTNKNNKGGKGFLSNIK